MVKGKQLKETQAASEEFVVKEYPRYTHWMEGKEVIGVGNLILTSERLIFLHQVELNEQRTDYIKKLSEEKATTSRFLDFALTLHKKNFEVPLTSVISVKTALYSLLPFPRPCLRISYMAGKQKTPKPLSFMFTIPLWKGWFQLEITTVVIWGKAIQRAMGRI